MDGLSGVASIIAVIQLVTSVLKFCYSVQERTSDIKETIYRLEILKNILYRLNDLETRCSPGTLPGLSELYTGPLPRCECAIKELESRLNTTLGVSGLRSLGKRVTWPAEKKEIEKLLARIEQDKMMFVLALSSDHAQQGIDIKDKLSAVDERIAAGHLSTRHQEVLRWLNNGLDPSGSHYNIWKKHQPTTGNWLIYGERYMSWKRDDSQPLLWLHGIPGCGKTVLCSTIINDLMLETQHRSDVALVYFYYDFNEEDQKRNNAAMLRSLLGQLACQTKTLTPSIDALYTSCATGARLPNEYEVSQAFPEAVSAFHQVYVVIDALDEGVEKDAFPTVLKHTSKLHVLTASRYHDDIAQALRHFDPTEILANARMEDIKVHVKSRLKYDSKLARLDSANKIRIEDTLVNGSGGM